jgi:hypothetical protein
MSELDGLINLLTKLKTSKISRDTQDKLFPIQQKIIDVQQEQLASDAKKHKEITDLKQDISDLKNAHVIEITELNTAHGQEIGKLNSKILNLESELTDKSSNSLNVPITRA